MAGNNEKHVDTASIHMSYLERGYNSKPDINPDATMRPIHMRVAVSPRPKRLQTVPANMSTAAATSHVVAPVRLFHGSLALGTILDPQALLGFLQGYVPARRNKLVIGTSHALV